MQIKTKQLSEIINRPELNMECESCPYYRDDHKVNELPCSSKDCKIKDSKELDE